MATAAEHAINAPIAPGSGSPGIYRHRLATRLWHWSNVVMLIIMPLFRGAEIQHELKKRLTV